MYTVKNEAVNYNVKFVLKIFIRVVLLEFQKGKLDKALQVNPWSL